MHYYLTFILANFFPPILPLPPGDFSLKHEFPGTHLQAGAEVLGSHLPPQTGWVSMVMGAAGGFPACPRPTEPRPNPETHATQVQAHKTHRPTGNPLHHLGEGRQVFVPLQVLATVCPPCTRTPQHLPAAQDLQPHVSLPTTPHLPTTEISGEVRAQERPTLQQGQVASFALHPEVRPRQRAPGEDTQWEATCPTTRTTPPLDKSRTTTPTCSV